jgi:hypothetical protein
MYLYFSDQYTLRLDKRSTTVPLWQKEVQLYLKLIIFAGNITFFVVFMYFLRFPHDKLFISSVIFSNSTLNSPSRRWWAFPIAAGLNLMTLVPAWALGLAFFTYCTLSVYMVIFVLEEMR